MANDGFLESLSSLLESKFIGYEINGDEGYITLQFDNGFLEVSGDDLEAYVEIDTIN